MTSPTGPRSIDVAIQQHVSAGVPGHRPGFWDDVERGWRHQSPGMPQPRHEPAATDQQYPAQVTQQYPAQVTQQYPAQVTQQYPAHQPGLLLPPPPPPPPPSGPGTAPAGAGLAAHPGGGLDILTDMRAHAPWPAAPGPDARGPGRAGPRWGTQHVAIIGAAVLVLVVGGVAIAQLRDGQAEEETTGPDRAVAVPSAQASAPAPPAPSAPATQAAPAVPELGGLPAEEARAALAGLPGWDGAGNALEGYRWEDAVGTHTLLLVQRPDAPDAAGTLDVVLGVADPAGQRRIERVMTEPTGTACPPGATNAFTPGSVRLGDADADGTAEVSVGWSVGCTAAGSAATKLALLEGGDKYILRDGVAAPDPPAWPGDAAASLQEFYGQLYG